MTDQAKHAADKPSKRTCVHSLINEDCIGCWEGRALRAAAECERLRAALTKIIALNRQTAIDQFGDAEQCETWACVRVAREALKVP